MQQAVDQMYGGHYPISVTHLYVRFKPANADQFTILEETEDLELQDYPMDYEVVQDGDYYQDSTLTTEEFGWLYTVVPASYSFPANIQYQVLDQLYLPEDDLFLEEVAESMAAGASYQSSYSSETGLVSIQRTDVATDTYQYPRIPCDCNDPTRDCLPEPGCDSDPGGGGGGGSDPEVPKGTIKVQEIASCGGTTKDVPVRQARVVCKRWFKIARTYTDDQGRFLSSKKFRNKVKVIVKARNDYGSIRKIRGIRVWQILFPVRDRLGVFEYADMAQITHTFLKPNSDGRTMGLWTAFTTHNSLIEFRSYASELEFGLPPNHLKVLMTNWGSMAGRGATPMLNKCLASLDVEFAAFFISNIVPFGTLANALSRQVDIVIGYNEDNYCKVTSATLKETAYHEFGHASHYAQVGCIFWNQYRQNIITELVKSKYFHPEYAPYGNGSDQTTVPLIGVSEMWGYHIGYLLTDRYFGFGDYSNNFNVIFQRHVFNNNYTDLKGAYLEALENYRLKLSTLEDVDHWIPKGLPLDLQDTGEPRSFTDVTDGVSGFSAKQCFDALGPSVGSVPAFRDALLQQNLNSQASAVYTLFHSYTY
ncbi:hypothetical protein [Flaviaesturariibacter terrae]